VPPPRARILIVEEQADTRETQARVFAEAGFEVYECADVAKAVDVLNLRKCHMVLMWCEGPESAATNDFLKTVLTRPEHAETRIFVLSRLPYYAGVRGHIGRPNLKLLTMPLTSSDIVNAVRVNLSPVRIGYDESLFEAVKDAVEHTLAYYLPSPVEVTGKDVRDEQKPHNGVLALIPLSSDRVLGSVALTFDKEFADTVTRGMLGDPTSDVPLEEHDVCEAVSEIVNQIAGVLKARLELLGLPVNIGLPGSTSGTKLALVHPGGNRVGVVAMSWKSGSFLKRLSLSLFSRVACEFCFDRVG
jgi:CheY-specific phosphatase CheX